MYRSDVEQVLSVSRIGRRAYKLLVGILRKNAPSRGDINVGNVLICQRHKGGIGVSRPFLERLDI